MNAILCSRGKGGGCRAVDIPVAEKRDLFGRTEAEIVAAIARGERVYAIASNYTGGEGLALKRARNRANLDVDRRCLAELCGPYWRAANPHAFTPLEEPVRVLAGDALAKWRKEICR